MAVDGRCTGHHPMSRKTVLFAMGKLPVLGGQSSLGRGHTSIHLTVASRCPSTSSAITSARMKLRMRLSGNDSIWSVQKASISIRLSGRRAYIRDASWISFSGTIRNRKDEAILVQVKALCKM